MAILFWSFLCLAVSLMGGQVSFADNHDVPKQEKTKGYAGQLAFRTDGAIQTHIAQKDLSVGFKTGHAVNPVERGHIAYRTDNIEAFKNHLESKGVPYSDYGHSAAVEWHQIFFYDPDGNIIEVHQVSD